jgi:hypothetical protein
MSYVLGSDVVKKPCLKNIRFSELLKLIGSPRDVPINDWVPAAALSPGKRTRLHTGEPRVNRTVPDAETFTDGVMLF